MEMIGWKWIMIYFRNVITKVDEKSTYQPGRLGTVGLNG